ncbi:MAG: hypothetical protein JRG96_06700 [Deltaproteobacteria bacterium]|nr:hypothetical protein [Deltaproteobacteria bacterium]MBW2420236.1 hypothetical protein [Deltaproteobacteria bacterium]
MGSVLRIAFIVGLVWVGMEFYVEGVDGAFGGVFSSRKEAEAASAFVSTPKRVEERVNRSIELGEERTRKLLDR